MPRINERRPDPRYTTNLMISNDNMSNYNAFQQQQMWTQQDWQYQDTTRQLNFGWQMEDLNEAIRFSSGRVL